MSKLTEEKMDEEKVREAINELKTEIRTFDNMVRDNKCFTSLCVRLSKKIENFTTAIEALEKQLPKNNIIEEKMKLNIKKGHAVAFDFDGVIHKYSKGWQDGSIYDEYNHDVLDLMLLLNIMKIPVFILSTREPKQIKEWWDRQGFTLKAEVVEPDTLFFNDLEYVGITRTKLPAQIYVDDRAYQYTGQTVKEFLLDFTEVE